MVHILKNIDIYDVIYEMIDFNHNSNTKKLIYSNLSSATAYIGKVVNKPTQNIKIDNMIKISFTNNSSKTPFRLTWKGVFLFA